MMSRQSGCLAKDHHLVRRCLSLLKRAFSNINPRVLMTENGILYYDRYNTFNYYLTVSIQLTGNLATG